MKLNIRNQKSPAQRISGTGARGFHFIGKTLILLWCGLTVAILVWVVAASLTSTKDIFQNDLLKGGIDLTGYKIVIERYHIMDYFFNSVLYTVCACVGLIFFCDYQISISWQKDLSSTIFYFVRSSRSHDSCASLYDDGQIEFAQFQRYIDHRVSVYGNCSNDCVFDGIFCNSSNDSV